MPATTRTLSRHPKAIAERRAAKLSKLGGGGGRKPGGLAPTIDQPASKNPPQKDFTPLSSVAVTGMPVITVPRDADVELSSPADAVPSPGMPPGDIGAASDTPHMPLAPPGAPLGLWRDGSFRAAIYNRPVNPRMLLLQFANGEHGKLVISPRERGIFNIGAEVWVKPAGGRDLYILCGIYNRYGVRCK